jgi:hypothetical protein
MDVMQTELLKARVVNGRLVLDEPTDLPEGREVSLAIVDEGDDLDDEERAALDAELDASLAEAEAGLGVDAEVVMAKLRAKSP